MTPIKWNGEKISKPGIYSGVPMDAYHGDLCVGPSISSSGLRLIEAKTPLHYFAGSYLNADRADEEQKDHLSFGKAAHTLLLEGTDGFYNHFAVRPDTFSDWRTKASQSWRDEQVQAGRTVILPHHLTTIRAIERQLKAHPLVQQGILDGLIEHAVVCKDAVTGVWLKIRPDVVPQADGVLVDMKTTNDASPDAIRRTILNYGYPMQGGLGTMVMNQALGIEITSFALVFVEKDEPHAVAVTEIDNEWIYWARRQLRRSIDTFAKCVETGEWPGYDVEATTTMPQWLRTRFEEQDKHGLIPEAA